MQFAGGVSPNSPCGFRIPAVGTWHYPKRGLEIYAVQSRARKPRDRQADAPRLRTNEAKPMCLIQQVANRGRLPFPPTAGRPLSHLVQLGGNLA